MKATALLKKQHRKVERILKRLENDESDASTLLTELANDLRLTWPSSRPSSIPR